MKWIVLACLACCGFSFQVHQSLKDEVMTVKGPIAASQMQTTLIHEHILVDFIGADKTHKDRWNKADVVRKVLPYLRELKGLGCSTLIECTPAYLGRDPELLKTLSDSSGLHILTNTGYYGAQKNKFLPAHALTETADQLAQRWIKEWEEGIEGTGIKPGFIKISVDAGPLSPIHQKLVQAAARTHQKTGLTIASHTGVAPAAFEQLTILEKEGVAPEAFIWVHAQAEKDFDQFIAAAKKGAWVSLDGLSSDNVDHYLKMLQYMRDKQLLHKVLISHDAGWYDPDNPAAAFRGYNVLFEKFIPLLRQHHFSADEIHLLTVVNPAKAFNPKIRMLKK
jgi:phosphotriesterase-related protein